MVIKNPKPETSNLKLQTICLYLNFIPFLFVYSLEFLMFEIVKNFKPETKNYLLIYFDFSNFTK